MLSRARPPVVPLRVALALASLVACLLPARAAGAATVRVAVGASVQAALDAAHDGDEVELAPGTHRGGVVVKKRVTLRGEGATLDGNGQGTVIRVEAAKTLVEDLAIRGSGKDLGAPDAGVYVAKSATRSVLRRLDIKVNGFAIWLHENEGSTIVDCHVTGSLEGNRPERGNAIQLFDSSHVVVRGNKVTGGRDGIYLSATDDSLIEDNEIHGTRYGIHYMYSQRNVVRRNHAKNNLTGITLMLSQGIRAYGNDSIDNKEYGFLVRDVEDCEINDNRSIGNQLGVFFYGSTDNVVKGNLIRDNSIGIKLWGGSVRNRFTENAFVGNRSQVFFVASEDLVFGEKGAGNYWSDYFGWDQNGDGFGDRPYRVDSFTNRLLFRFPSAALLLRSPSLELLAHLEERMPLMRVPTVVDLHPLVSTSLK